MGYKKYLFALLVLNVCLLLVRCTSDPILPPGVIVDPNNPNINPANIEECPPGIISFQYEVLPVLISNCAYSGCHDATTAEDDVILDSYDNVIKEVDAGDPNNSELYESIIDTDPEDIMPPPGYSPLSNDQKNLIRDWIQQGGQNTNCGAPCDSTASSFAANIYPIVEAQCLGCHNSSFTQGNVNLDNYNNIIPYIDDGSFLGSIEFVAGFSKMPPSGNQLLNCNIEQIRKWIDEGALDN